jgi:hypothetical protein
MVFDDIDVRYFERRATEAHRRADEAAGTSNERIHRQLAYAYERRIGALRSGAR